MPHVMAKSVSEHYPVTTFMIFSRNLRFILFSGNLNEVLYFGSAGFGILVSLCYSPVIDVISLLLITENNCANSAFAS